MFARVTLSARWILGGLLLMVVGSGTASGDEAQARCGWRTGEKLGVGFAEICTPPSAPEGPLGESAAEVASFWMSAAPLPCSRGSRGTIDCPVATSILTARSRAKDVLEPRSEGCRLVIFPPVLTWERSEQSVLQACRASFAPAWLETAIQPGAPCVGGTCTVRILPALQPEAFELTCRTRRIGAKQDPVEPMAERAAFRCVVPESALGVVGGKTSR